MSDKKQWAIKYTKTVDDPDYDENSFRIIVMDNLSHAKLWMQLWKEVHGNTDGYSIVHSEINVWEEWKE